MIYVDPLARHGMKYNDKSVKSCHMFSENNDKQEVLDFGLKIGMKKKWLQVSNIGFYHFDLMFGKRILAVLNGAVGVSWHEAVKIMKSALRRR